MKRIYPNTDIVFNITANKIPYTNKDLLERLDFKFYTSDSNSFVDKHESDITEDGNLILTADELSYLSEGVLRYDYVADDQYKNDILTNYYIANKAVWGDLGGQIENQRDLIDYIHKEIDKAFDQATQVQKQIKEYNKK